jgi:hypothetical protein
MDAIHLSIRPRFCAIRYARIKAYENHFRVLEDNHANTMATYDIGVASMFQQEQVSKEGTTLGPIHCGNFERHNCVTMDMCHNL